MKDPFTKNEVKIVVIGGGTGSFTMLSALKGYTSQIAAMLNLSGIFWITDNTPLPRSPQPIIAMLIGLRLTFAKRFSVSNKPDPKSADFLTNERRCIIRF